MLDYDGLYTAVVRSARFHATNGLFRGTYVYWGVADNAKIGTLSAGNDEPSLYGRRTMCFINNEGVSPMSRKFIHVLIAR